MKRVKTINLFLIAMASLPVIARSAEPAFVAQTIDSEIQIGYGLAIGDVNGDGRDDILLADKRDFFWYQNPTWERHLFWTLATEDNQSTMRDNVCIAARDIDGDSKVEVAVGTNWNPGETVSEEASGGVWFVGSLGKIKPVKLPHEPTTHRMGWVRKSDGHSLVVVPLHGRGNQGGAGENGSRIFAYQAWEDPYASSWEQVLVEDRFHKTHNFDVITRGARSKDTLLLGGGEGFTHAHENKGKWNSSKLEGLDHGPGEVRVVTTDRSGYPREFATIEPMHGNNVAFYQRREKAWSREVLDDRLNQGHALAVADFLGTGETQIAAGWRNPDKSGKVGIRLYQPGKDGEWTIHLIDDNTMACEDLKAADLDGDGKVDLIASGRRSKNVIIYWNRSGQ